MTPVGGARGVYALRKELEREARPRESPLEREESRAEASRNESRHCNFVRWLCRREADDVAALKKEVAEYLKGVRRHQRDEASLPRVDMLLEEVVK